jgi:hypothetical protein
MRGGELETKRNACRTLEEEKGDARKSFSMAARGKSSKEMQEKKKRMDKKKEAHGERQRHA